MKDVEFSLRLIGLQVLHAHSAQLLKGLVQVSHSHPAPQWEGHGTGRVSQIRYVGQKGWVICLGGGAPNVIVTVVSRAKVR